jgi:putative DNA primase/helicase
VVAAARGPEGTADAEAGTLRIDGDVPRFDLTDVGHATRFHARAGAHIRYVVEEKRWIVWDGKAWARDTTGAVRRLMWQTVGDELEHETLEAECRAKAADDDQERKTWYGVADSIRAARKYVHSRNGIAAVLEVTQSIPGCSVSTTSLDPCGTLLTFSNGTLDLVTGKLRRPDPADLITLVLDYEFDPKSKAPYFERTLRRILPDDEHAEFVQRVFGRAIIALNERRTLSILWGQGRNGKSTVIGGVRSAIEPYVVEADPATLLERKGDRIENDLARMSRARLVLVRELPENRRLDENLVKQLTGGDLISARYLYGEYFTYAPGFVVCIASNAHPIMSDQAAMRDRIAVIPFTVTIPKEEEDRTLQQRFKSERAGIFNWLYAGYKSWRTAGLALPASIAEFTGAVAEEGLPFERFITDCLERLGPGSGRYLSTERAYVAYTAWARRQGLDVPSKSWFGRRMGERGFTPGRFGKLRDRGFPDLMVNSDWVGPLKEGLKKARMPFEDNALFDGFGGSTPVGAPSGDRTPPNADGF